MLHFNIRNPFRKSEPIEVQVIRVPEIGTYNFTEIVPSNAIPKGGKVVTIFSLEDLELEGVDLNEINLLTDYALISFEFTITKVTNKRVLAIWDNGNSRKWFTHTDMDEILAVCVPDSDELETV
jgi:hypothetical protein